MAEARQLDGMPALLEYLRDRYGQPIPASYVRVERYGQGPDTRIGWAETWAVIIDGWGIVGFTNAPIEG